MTALLDTSVLVAALVEGHPEHARCLPWLAGAAAGSRETCVSSHSLAECYSVLTTLPVRPRISPAAASRLLAESVERHCRLVALTATEVEGVVRRCASLELAGGIVYDALIARAAEKAGAKRLVTLNTGDFERAWPEGGSRIVLP